MLLAFSSRFMDLAASVDTALLLEAPPPLLLLLLLSHAYGDGLKGNSLCGSGLGPVPVFVPALLVLVLVLQGALEC
jgi:hypothetical protein